MFFCVGLHPELGQIGGIQIFWFFFMLFSLTEKFKKK